LYKKSKTGKNNEWEILVEVSEIKVIHGQADGKKQIDSTVIEKGKNLGKINFTTKEEQAELQAESKWKKQLDKGYVEDINDVDVIVYLPMLAQTFSKIDDKTGKEKGRKKHIKYPALISRKLDGVRCLASVEDGKVILLTRKNKRYPHLEHLFEMINEVLSNDNIILDGELYVHGEGTFQRLVGLVKRETLTDEDKEDMKLIKYRVYDCIVKDDLNMSFVDRFNHIKSVISQHGNKIEVVENEEINSEQEIDEIYGKYMSEGYEGAMLRNKDGIYGINERSNDLQKYKKFFDDEFKVIDIVDGVGRAKGTAILVCETKDGQEFRARPKGTDEYRKELFLNKDNYIGLDVTVTYFELTDDGIPRFPVAKGFRGNIDGEII